MQKLLNKKQLQNILFQCDFRAVIASCIFSIIITLFLLLGSTSQFTVGLSFKDALCLAFPQFIALFFLFYCCCRFFSNHRLAVSSSSVSGSSWIFSFVILFLVWGINWLIFSPGYWTSDSVSSVKQALGEGELSNHHPIVFTAIVAIFVNLGNAFGSLEAGMAAFTLFTMVFFAFCCSYLCAWVYARTSNRYVLAGTLLFFALNILLAQYSITAWKDVYFSPLLLIFIIKIADLVCSKGDLLQSRSYLIGIALLSLLVMLFRSNGVFVVFITLVVAAITYCRFWKKLAFVTATCLLLYFFISGPIFSYFGIADKATRETYAVPLQQIAKTIIDDGQFSTENRAYLEGLFSFDEIKDSYNPYTVDPVKWANSFDDDYLRDTQLEFIKVWLETFPSNISSYVEAYRDLTLGFWYPSVDNWLIRFSGYEYFDEMNEWNSATVDLDSRVLAPDGTSWISYNMEKSATLVNIIDCERHLPILNTIYSIGAMVWLLIGVVVLKLFLRKKKDAIILLPLVLLWVSLLIATPTFCEFRYILTLHLALPLIFVLAVYDFDNS